MIYDLKSFVLNNLSVLLLQYVTNSQNRIRQNNSDSAILKKILKAFILRNGCTQFSWLQYSKYVPKTAVANRVFQP